MHYNGRLIGDIYHSSLWANKNAVKYEANVFKWNKISFDITQKSNYHVIGLRPVSMVQRDGSSLYWWFWFNNFSWSDNYFRQWYVCFLPTILLPVKCFYGDVIIDTQSGGRLSFCVDIQSLDLLTAQTLCMIPDLWKSLIYYITCPGQTQAAFLFTDSLTSPPNTGSFTQLCVPN